MSFSMSYPLSFLGVRKIILLSEIAYWMSIKVKIVSFKWTCQFFPQVNVGEHDSTSFEEWLWNQKMTKDPISYNDEA